MVSLRQPLTRSDRSGQALSVPSPSPLPAAFDGGFGFSKLELPKHAITTPALITPVHQQLHDLPRSQSGGCVSYVSGPRADLCRSRWLTGFPAYQYQPKEHFRVTDHPDGKIKYGLQLLLGCLATLPYQPAWDLQLVTSIQDAQTMGGRLAEALAGQHTVAFADSPPSTVTIRVSRVFEESYGVITANGGRFATTRQMVVLDLGFGTTIVSLFGEGGRLMQRQVRDSGVEKLLSAIAEHPETRRTLKRVGDIVLIREAIEQQTFIYGTTGWSFHALYIQELTPWVESVLAPALSLAAPWIASANAVIAIGGGSQLPVIETVLQQKGIHTLKNGARAHVQGLLLLAKATLGQAKGGL